MRPEDILRFLRTRPFEPFRIHMSDGTTYDVAHAELALVERSVVIVGVPGSKGPGRAAGTFGLLRAGAYHSGGETQRCGREVVEWSR